MKFLIIFSASLAIFFFTSCGRVPPNKMQCGKYICDYETGYIHEIDENKVAIQMVSQRKKSVNVSRHVIPPMVRPIETIIKDEKEKRDKEMNKMDKKAKKAKKKQNN